ncbi:Vacuolar protein sorting-associated protein 37A [Mactra antiquata]
MPWFGQGGKKGKLPGATDLQIQRSKQIESLRRGSLNVVETLRDAEYRLQIVAAGNSLTLIINLPPQFPQDKPVITVQPPVRHPWVDMNSKVSGCSSINNFSMHSSLQTAIQCVIDEFKSNPPALVAHAPYQSVTPNRGYPSMFPVTTNIFSIYPSMPNYTSSNSNITTSTSTSQVQETVTSTSCESNIPNINQINVNTSFPELKDKSRTEMLEILNEEEKILDLIQQVPEVKQIVENLEKLSLSCTDLAKENLTKKPVIEELKCQVQEKHEEFNRLRAEFEGNQEKQLQLMDQFHPAVIQSNLKVAILEAEEDSDRVVEDFLDKKLDVDEFTTKFIEKRSLYHTRRAKEEKMNNMNLGF